jgi:hypothetical protein
MGIIKLETIQQNLMEKYMRKVEKMMIRGRILLMAQLYCTLSAQQAFGLIYYIQSNSIATNFSRPQKCICCNKNSINVIENALSYGSNNLKK